MHQLSLLPPSSLGAPERVPLDPESENVLAQFVALRRADGAHPRTVAREVSQLRSVAREAGVAKAPMSLAGLFADLSAIAHALCEPRASIARSTGRARLLAVQRFIAVMGPLSGRDADADLRTLDMLLPNRPQRGWYDAGILVAGTRERRGAYHPTLSPVDLDRIIEAAGHDPDRFRMIRDRAFVALHCYSGLRPEEVIRLRWEQIELGGDGAMRNPVAVVERNGHRVRLPILGPATRALKLHADTTRSMAGTIDGATFRRSASGGESLSYRAGRKVVVHACQAAGLPAVGSVELRGAYASWLRSQGLSDHEVAAVLGIARVRSVDRLLARHIALNSQRLVREQLR